jgi:hypothetical protein
MEQPPELSSQKPLESGENNGQGISQFSYVDLERKSRLHIRQYLKNDCVYLTYSTSTPFPPMEATQDDPIKKPSPMTPTPTATLPILKK